MTKNLVPRMRLWLKTNDYFEAFQKSYFLERKQKLEKLIWAKCIELKGNYV